MTTIIPPLPHEIWLQFPTEHLTSDAIPELLEPIPDDLWVTAACLERSEDDIRDAQVQRALLDFGLQRTRGAVERSQQAFSDDLVDGEDKSATQQEEDVKSYWSNVPTDEQICRMRAELLKRLDKLNTWVELCKSSTRITTAEKAEEEEDDDPWADNNDEQVENEPATSDPPIPLPEFMAHDILDSAFRLASESEFDAVQTLLEYHTHSLWPLRFEVIDRIPDHAPPSDWIQLLPKLDSTGEAEAKVTPKTHRGEDWVEIFGLQEPVELSHTLKTVSDVLAPSQLAEWYKTRASNVVNSSGLIDVALSTIQHAASYGIPNLDELGEDLSLLARLVYDAPASPEILSTSREKWSLEKWHAMESPAVVRAYLRYCTEENVGSTITRLVVPYLFVAEVRAERAGEPDPGLTNRLLTEYILAAPLDLAAAIFEASKPTLPAGQRIIKSDEELARLALACIYGSNTRTEWPTMSRIFECLPAWEVDDDDADEADTTVASLGAFVVPTTSRPRCTPSDLLLFFKPLPKPSLSRALDILDVHLESGEILSRWNVPALPQWFLQSSDDASEQRAWANRMARRTGVPGNEMKDTHDWQWLLEDMLKLAGTGDGNLRGGFGLLTKDEITQIFFSGLLSSGKFVIAKELLKPKSGKLSLPSTTIEDLCLTASREFYDNASSGNYKFGDMKQAYDCLDVPRTSPTIVKEKEFIEATSRIASFNVMSRPGIPITPLEIRLTKDRLTLVSRVLAGHSDAYKHSQVILELVHKLGYKNDAVAEVKTLAMLADAALLADDFPRTLQTSQEMIDKVHALRKARGLDDTIAQQVSEVCWISCFQLGRHPEFDQLDKKLWLVSQALELCPAEKIHEILVVWSRLEDEDAVARKERVELHKAGKLRVHHQTKATSPSVAAAGISLASRLQGLGLPGSSLGNGDAVDLASRAFNRVANFPFSGRAVNRTEGEQERSESREGTRKRDEASRLMQKGIGWLIGADDN